MGTEPSEILNHRAINAWNLFWLITVPVSMGMIVVTFTSNTTSGNAVSSMIQLSVRCAVPLLYIVFAASAIRTLFPGPVSRWLMRNRKCIGLSFAAAMAWQAFFILWMTTIYTDYYLNEIYVLRDAIEGVVGYLFLIAMTVTSFRWGRKRMNPGQWRLLHLSGIYFLWAYAFSVYWWAVFYYPNPLWIDQVFYWAGLLVWGLRAAAWSKQRRRRAERFSAPAGAQTALRMTGITLVGVGLIAAGLGSEWRPLAEDFLYGYAITRIPELYLPYWPFEPFLPLFVILAGTYFISTSGEGSVRARTARERQTGGALGT